MLSVTYVRYSQGCARYLLRDRDGKYGQRYRARARTLGIEEVVIAPRSPSQNPFVERGLRQARLSRLCHRSRRRHLRKTLRSYLNYYHGSRTHLSLNKDSPDPRPVEQLSQGDNIVAQVGGLHHRYEGLAA